MKTELTAHERDVACYRSALRDASSTKDEKELEVLEKAIDELADIIGHDVAIPILEEEIARQQAARREAEAERDELLAQIESFKKNQMKLYNSVLSFGTTVHHQQEDGSDLTRDYVLECVTDRIDDIFSHGEQMEAFWLEDTCEEEMQREIIDAEV